MDIERYTVEGRNATLYITDSRGSPLVVLNNYSEDGGPVVKILKEMACSDFNLLCVGNLCQRRCDFVVFRRMGNVEKWRVKVSSL